MWFGFGILSFVICVSPAPRKRLFDYDGLFGSRHGRLASGPCTIRSRGNDRKRHVLIGVSFPYDTGTEQLAQLLQDC